MEADLSKRSVNDEVSKVGDGDGSLLRHPISKRVPNKNTGGRQVCGWQKSNYIQVTC